MSAGPTPSSAGNINTSFDVNDATIDAEDTESGNGGALTVESDSTVDRVGAVSFQCKVLRIDCGCLFVNDASVFWRGNTP